MSEHIERATALAQEAPEKCAECPFLDKEHDPFSGATRLYCRAPWWHPKRWSCALPKQVARA
jgi:hypothetical protein